VSYVIASYAVTLGTLALYGLQLARERRALRQAIGAGARQNPG
jgi:hypothetical protein